MGHRDSLARLWPFTLAVGLLGLLHAVVVVAGDLPRPVEDYNVEQFKSEDIAAAARTGTPIELQFFGKSCRVILEASNVRSPRFRATRGTLVEQRTVYPSEVRNFKGHVVDEPDSVVRLSIVAGGIRGFIKSQDGWTFIEPLQVAQLNVEGDSGAGDHKVFTESDFDPNFFGECAAPLLAEGADSIVHQHESVAEADEDTSSANIKVLELAVDADVEFFAIYGAQTTNEIETTLNMVNGIFESDLNLTIELVSLKIWDAEPDPYDEVGAANLLGELRNHWNLQNGAISRDAVHLFTGKDLTGSTVGIAYLSVVCNLGAAYAISQDLGSDVLMPLLVAHELGHNLGTNHDATGSTPRYIMYPSLGASNLDEFSAFTQTNIGNYVNAVGCLELQAASSPAPAPGPTAGGGGGPVDPLLVLIVGGACLARGLRARKRNGTQRA
jgi:hypothetical protein